MSIITKDLGAASAYAYAVEKGYTGTESQFAQDMANLAEISAEAETLSPDAEATASYSNGLLSFGIPKGAKGDKGNKGDKGDKGNKGDVGNGIVSIVKTATDGQVDTYTITFTDGGTTTFTVTNGSGGLDTSQRMALLNCFEHVAWSDAQGQTYYDELKALLFPPVVVTGISATYVNSDPVYPDADLDDLRPYITVTATYSDESTEVVNAYTLSGTLAVGNCTVTVAYSGFTTTITVTVVAKPKSDMTQWTDGVMYTDIEYISGSYYNNAGGVSPYSSWSRSGYIPCDGASRIVFEPYGTNTGSLDKTFCWFFDENKNPLSQFVNNMPEYLGGEQPVPTGAHYFGFSDTTTKITNIATAGFTPYA